MRSLLFFAAVLLAFASCSNNNRSMKQLLATADSTTVSAPKIVHSADLSYRVQDVLKATTQTEQWVKGLGGVVTKSEMHNETVSVKDMPYKRDSLKHTQIYAPTASMVVEVPTEKMDSFMNLLGANAAFVNHRTITQQDMTLAYLANALKNENVSKQAQSEHYPTSKMDSKTALAAREQDKDAANEQVDRRLANLQILQQADYATLTIDYTQAEQINVQVIADTNYAIQTPFGTQLLMALSNGISMLRAIIVLIVQLWPLWLLVLAGLYVYKRRRKLMLNRQGN